jgi:hypothetical protein
MTGFQFRTWVWAFAPDDRCAPGILHFPVELGDGDTVIRGDRVAANRIYISPRGWS